MTSSIFFWFNWIEQTRFSIWMRESTSVLAFPNILFLHTLAMGFLAGTNAAVDLRVLGFAPEMRLAPMEKFFPLMWSSFWVMLVTGLLLLFAYPTKAFTNPVWYVKFAFVALALRNTRSIQNQMFRDPRLDAQPMRRQWKVLASTSLIFWAGAITAGKLLGHTYTRLYAH